jgi:D-alanyl-D-alanine carboxypeptidase
MRFWNKSNNLLIFIFILIVLEAFLLLSSNFELKKKQESDAIKSEETRLARIQQIFDTNPVLAKTFSVYDETDKKEIYSKNGNDILPFASLSKIMTVLVALENHKPDDIITISQNSTETDKNYALTSGEKWTVGDLAKFTLIASSNDGARILAMNDPNFLKKMNQKAIEIGMQNSTFSNFTGLDLDVKKAGSYGKALDVNYMALYAIEKYPEIFNATVAPDAAIKSLSGYEHDIKNTNKITEEIPGLLFSKTGLTTLAGGNLTVIFRNRANHMIAITLLGSTQEGRFSDMEKLVGIAYNLEYGTGN